MRKRIWAAIRAARLRKIRHTTDQVMKCSYFFVHGMCSCELGKSALGAKVYVVMTLAMSRRVTIHTVAADGSRPGLSNIDPPNPKRSAASATGRAGTKRKTPDKMSCTETYTAELEAISENVVQLAPAGQPPRLSRRRRRKCQDGAHGVVAKSCGLHLLRNLERAQADADSMMRHKLTDCARVAS